MTNQCVHSYHYQGLVYSDGQQLPGSAAKQRHYFDLYFCTKCLNRVWKEIDVQKNSYENPLPGSHAAPKDLKLVP